MMASAVVDFTEALPACAICGAAGSFQAFPDGMLVSRWRCGHTSDDQEVWLHEDKIHAGLYPWEDADDG